MDVLKLEKYIIERYGEKGLPRIIPWTPEQEKEHLKEAEKKYSGILGFEDFIETARFLISKSLFINKTDRVCQKCGSYSFSNTDNFYLLKHKICFSCHAKKEDLGE